MISTQCSNAYEYSAGRKASKHILQDIHQMKRVQLLPGEKAGQTKRKDKVR